MRQMLPLLLVLTGACELTEVTVPTGEPRLVVQAVLSRGSERQFVYVEDARIGQARPDTFITDAPNQPVRDAVVTLTHPDGTQCGPAVETLPAVAERPGVYEATGLCVPAPGDVIRLRVEAPDGRVVTGATTVPGARAVTVFAAGDTASAAQDFLFDRDHDTLRVNADPVLARAMQVEVRRHGGLESVYYPAQSPLVFFAVLDRMALTLPGAIVNPFEEDSGEVVFRAGIVYDLTVAVTDTNYFDYTRSFSDPLTGRGFINHLDGGLGVFGAVEPHTVRVRAVADIDDPREGVYGIEGVLEGRAVDATLELYLDAVDSSIFAAFIDGVWYGEPVHASVDGLFGVSPGLTNQFEAHLLLPGAPGIPQVWTLRGERVAGSLGFRVSVAGENVQSGTLADPVVGTVLAVQMSGPGP